MVCIPATYRQNNYIINSNQFKTTNMSSKKVEAQKRTIARKTAQFEKRMLGAANDLERVQVLNDMEDILEAEIIQWNNILVQESSRDKIQQKNLEDNVSKEVGNLQEVINMINTQRKELLPSAKQLAQARRNSHLKVEPTKHVTDHD